MDTRITHDLLSIGGTAQLAILSFLACMIIPVALAFYSRRHYFRQLYKIPGYKDWPLVGDALHLKRDPTEFYDQLLEITTLGNANNSGILRVTFGTYAIVCISRPNDIEKLLRSNELIDKSVDYDILHKWLGTGLLTSTGQKWKTRRRLLTPSFHFNILKEFLKTMNVHAQALQEKLQVEKSDKGVSFDIFPYITLNALDIICDTAMGVNMEALHNNGTDYVKAVYMVKDAAAVRQRTPWYWPDIIYDHLPLGKKVNEGIDTMHKYAYKVIAERRQLHKDGDYGDKHKAFLDTLLDCKDENDDLLSDEDIREEVDTFMFEGHDTVSAATAHAVHLLGAHPEIQKKCQEELDEIFHGPRDITYDDLSKMTYLEWCIKEAMRLYPSVPWFGRSLSTETEFSGYLVPEGATMVVVVMSLHRDPEIYPDPEKFDPLRFSPDQTVNRHPFAYIPFSAGPRNCIGQKFAMMELKVIMATLLRSFNIHSTQKREEVKPNPGLVLQPAAGIHVKLTSRI